MTGTTTTPSTRAVRSAAVEHFDAEIAYRVAYSAHRRERAPADKYRQASEQYLLLPRQQIVAPVYGFPYGLLPVGRITPA